MFAEFLVSGERGPDRRRGATLDETNTAGRQSAPDQRAERRDPLGPRERSPLRDGPRYRKLRGDVPCGPSAPRSHRPRHGPSRLRRTRSRPASSFIGRASSGPHLPRRFFDTILLCAVSTLEHIGLPYYDQPSFSDGDRLTLAEVRELLRQEGRLIATVPPDRARLPPGTGNTARSTSRRSFVTGIARSSTALSSGRRTSAFRSWTSSGTTTTATATTSPWGREPWRSSGLPRNRDAKKREDRSRAARIIEAPMSKLPPASGRGPDSRNERLARLASELEGLRAWTSAPGVEGSLPGKVRGFLYRSFRRLRMLGKHQELESRLLEATIEEIASFGKDIARLQKDVEDLWSIPADLQFLGPARRRRTDLERRGRPGVWGGFSQDGCRRIAPRRSEANGRCPRGVAFRIEGGGPSS